jgi:hypothetical protein
MTILPVALASIGMVAGGATVVLGVAQLTCEHATSPWIVRATTVLLSILAASTAIDCWEVWAGAEETLDPKAIAFCVALAMSWGYRRTFGFTSQSRRRPPA